MRTAFVCAPLCAWLASCGPADTPSGVDAGSALSPFFSIDVEETFTEVRDCRQSIDHDLTFIRVFADAAALAPYASREEPFPAGALVVKVEYADDACADRSGFTAMQKRATGEDADAGDWRWQRATGDGEVTESGAPARCIACHRACGQPPGGYDWTCAEEG